jgi:imidazolonepropionase-like amidohydrolase
MNRKQTRAAAALLAAACFLVWLGAADQRAWVIRDARVHTIGPAGSLQRASIVITDGKITAVGSNVKVPPGAAVINGQGLEVYPGMINAWGNLGLTEIPAVPATVVTSEMGEFNPHLLAFTAIHPASEHFPVVRVNGITTALSAPSGGVIPGQAVLLHLDGWTNDEMAIRKSAGMVIEFPSLAARRGRFGGGGFEGARRQTFAERRRTYDRQVRELTELLESARHYAAARAANPATERDRKLDALVPVVKGEMTVFLAADSARDIRNAVDFAKKEKLKFVLQGGREANQVADLLKKENIRVILESIVALPMRDDDPYDARFTLPRDLAKAGVKFALTSPSTEFARDLPYEAGFAQAYGLTHADALRAVTLTPAEILGVASQIGSIEVGKIADLVVTDGDLLEIRTQVKNVFVAGRNLNLETKHTRLYERYLNRP